MASTLKVTNINTPDGTGSITFDRPIAGDGSGLTSLPSSTSGLENDISILALNSAIQNNQTAHGLSNSWIEQFEDSTFIENLSTVSRDTTSEYVSSITGSSGSFVSDSQTSLLIHSDTTNGSTTFTDSSSYGDRKSVV